jgi:hypothetical protein
VWSNPVKQQSKDRPKIRPQHVELGKCVGGSLCKSFKVAFWKGLLKKFVISLRNGFVYFESLKRVLYNRALLSRVHITCDSQVYGRRSVKEKIFDRQIFLDGR